jgi:hypothetical protein
MELISEKCLSVNNEHIPADILQNLVQLQKKMLKLLYSMKRLRYTEKLLRTSKQQPYTSPDLLYDESLLSKELIIEDFVKSQIQKQSIEKFQKSIVFCIDWGQKYIHDKCEIIKQLTLEL